LAMPWSNAARLQLSALQPEKFDRSRSRTMVRAEITTTAMAVVPAIATRILFVFRFIFLMTERRASGSSVAAPCADSEVAPGQRQLNFPTDDN
jgi:hypothetical protein